MFDHFNRNDNIELLGAFGETFGRFVPIVDGEVVARSVSTRSFDVLACCINRGDSGSHAGERLGDQPAAAADIKHGQSVKRLHRARVQPKMGAHVVANISKTHGVELMERPKSTVLVPPFIGKGRKSCDLVCRRIVCRFVGGRVVRVD